MPRSAAHVDLPPFPTRRSSDLAGGFTPGEADKLRRAMATFKRTGTIGMFKSKMIEGMVARNYPRDFAERCFSQIEGFEIGRAHVWTPVTSGSRMPSSA